MDLNRLISYSLRIGVLASSALSLTALAIWAATGFTALNTASGTSVGNAIRSAFDGSGAGLIYLAVAVLVATPIFRVAMSTIYFARENDKKYVVITLAVLTMLIFALASGVVG